jgi:hypothetical protein
VQNFRAVRVILADWRSRLLDKLEIDAFGILEVENGPSPELRPEVPLFGLAEKDAGVFVPAGVLQDVETRVDVVNFDGTSDDPAVIMLAVRRRVR